MAVTHQAAEDLRRVVVCLITGEQALRIRPNVLRPTTVE